MCQFAMDRMVWIENWEVISGWHTMDIPDLRVTSGSWKTSPMIGGGIRKIVLTEWDTDGHGSRCLETALG